MMERDKKFPWGPSKEPQDGAIKDETAADEILLDPMETESDSEEVFERERKSISILRNANLDLDTYVSQYRGHNLLYRLEFIADHCHSLRVEALKMGVDYAKDHTKDTQTYLRLLNKLNEASSDPATSGSYQEQQSSQMAADIDWIDKSNRKLVAEKERLTEIFSTLQTSGMRESLEGVQNELGDLHVDHGQFEAAVAAYLKACDCAQSVDRQLYSLGKMVKILCILGQWAAIPVYIKRVDKISHASTEKCQSHISQLHCAIALNHIQARRYKEAARELLTNVSQEHFDKDLGILAQVNVAHYGGLCALATFSRDELARLVLQNVSFKSFLELDPSLREAICSFHKSCYAQCFTALKELEDQLLLDIYLAPHVKRLYRAVKDRAILQYLEPYKTCCLRRMALSLSFVTPEELEGRVVDLIVAGRVRARIDSHTKILYAQDDDLRCALFDSAVSLGAQWQRCARGLIARTAIRNMNMSKTRKIETICGNDLNVITIDDLQVLRRLRREMKPFDLFE